MMALVRGEKHPANAFRRDVLTVAIDIRENRGGPAHRDATGGSHKGAAGNDDFVAGLNAQRIERQFQGQTAIGQRDRIFAARGSGKFAFKQPAFLAGPVIHFARLQHRGGRFNFGRAEERPGSKRSAADRLIRLPPPVSLSQYRPRSWCFPSLLCEPVDLRPEVRPGANDLGKSLADRLIAR